MHPFSILTLAIFVAGYITARFDLVIRLYELAIFAWDHGVVARTTEGFLFLSLAFLLLASPVAYLAYNETIKHPRPIGSGISAREQLKRRGSFNS